MLDIQRVTALCLMRERLATGGIIRARLLYIGLCIVLCTQLYIAVYWNRLCHHAAETWRNISVRIPYTTSIIRYTWTSTSWIYGRRCIINLINSFPNRVQKTASEYNSLSPSTINSSNTRFVFFLASCSLRQDHLRFQTEFYILYFQKHKSCQSWTCLEQYQCVCCNSIF